ncbi:hypothetical protein [Lysobacter tyrosinilyticus]
MSRFFVLGVLTMLSGCATGGSVAPNQDIALTVNQQVTLPDATTLRYVGIANDSRCPPKVQCVRAGDADVLFDYADKGAPASRVTLNTERILSTHIGAWRLQLVALAPGANPQVTVRIEARGATP